MSFKKLTSRQTTRITKYRTKRNKQKGSQRIKIWEIKKFKQEIIDEMEGGGKSDMNKGKEKK